MYLKCDNDFYKILTKIYQKPKITTFKLPYCTSLPICQKSNVNMLLIINSDSRNWWCTTGLRCVWIAFINCTRCYLWHIINKDYFCWLLEWQRFRSWELKNRLFEPHIQRNCELPTFFWDFFLFHFTIELLDYSQNQHISHIQLSIYAWMTNFLYVMILSPYILHNLAIKCIVTYWDEIFEDNWFSNQFTFKTELRVVNSQIMRLLVIILWLLLLRLCHCSLWWWWPTGGGWVWVA